MDNDVLAVVIDADREVEIADREAETRGEVAKDIEESDL